MLGHLGGSPFNNNETSSILRKQIFKVCIIGGSQSSQRELTYLILYLHDHRKC